MSDYTAASRTGADEVRARRARPGDEAEVARLRELMNSTLFGPTAQGPWTVETLARLTRWLADPDAATTAVFVVDAPDGVGLAACVIGSYSDRLPSQRNPHGTAGYVYGVSTEPRWQRRGYSRAAMVALLEWFDQRGVVRIDLHASEFGEGLYRKLGFAEASGAALTALRH